MFLDEADANPYSQISLIAAGRFPSLCRGALEVRRFEHLYARLRVRAVRV